jgi:TrmH family RNA methyltransferase
MKNFGCSDLVLVNPACDHLDKDARARAMHAKDVLRDAVVVESWPRVDYLVGTTAMLGGDYNLKRSPVSPDELGARLARVDGDVGLVFGPEDCGLTNEQVKRCDFVVAVPTHPSYPTMNLSHAATVVLYEVFKHSDEAGIGDNIEPIGTKEKEVLLELIDTVLETLPFQTDDKRETQKLLWRRIVGKSMLTNRESQALMGLFRNVEFHLED